ncbi:MAG TPA: protein kinase, partial [Roseiflexaceae bacterium]|nr:protein kinase [Roseiflexaceae bacterium]
KRASRAGGLLFALVAIVLLAATLALAFPDLVARYVPVQTPLAAPTPQTLVQRPYSVDLEVIVPPGGDVRAAFVAAYTAAAQAQFGPATRINTNAPLAYVGGEPQKLGEDASGAKYRATVSGYVLVPLS